MPEANRTAIMQTLTDRFAFLFKQLAVANTNTILGKYVAPVKVEKTRADFAEWGDKPKEVLGLSD